MNEILILVPNYNGENNILKIFQKINDLNLSNIKILFVDDGSNDNSLQILKNNNIEHIFHKNNKGKGEAIKSGIDHAFKNKFKWIITIDSDLQHSPNKIQDFINLRNKKTIILGWRKSKKNMPILRIFSNVITSLLISLRTKTKILDSQCGFRMFPVNVINDFKCVESGFQYESEFLIRAVMNGYKINHVQIPTIYNNEKSSMRNVPDTFKFITMYLKSFFW